MTRNIAINKDFKFIAVYCSYPKLISICLQSEPIVRDMLVNANGDYWKHVRKVVSPAFSAARVKKLHPLMREQTKYLVDEAHAQAESGDCCVQVIEPFDLQFDFHMFLQTTIAID